MTTRVVLASADGHVGPTTEDYRGHLETRLHGAFDEFLAAHRYRWTPERDESFFRPSTRDPMRSHPRHQDGGMASLHDPHRRLRELDADGVAVEVLFADDQNLNTPPWLAGIAPQAFDSAVHPAELRLAGARAYNRWLAGFCSTAPERFLGMITIGSLHDVGEAVAELERACHDGLTAGVMLPLDYYLPLYHHPRYDRFWAACVDLDLTVTVHAGTGGPDWYGEGLRGSAVYLAELNMFAQRPLWCLILGGVFDRYPGLRVVFTEQGSSWVPGLLARLDGVAASNRMRWTDEEPLAMTPSEYFHRHCFVGNSLMTPQDVAERQQVGLDVLMWGSDFPHLEGAWPETAARVRTLFGGVPETEGRAVLGENLVRAYRLDRASVEAIAEQIGPTPDEVGLVASS
jgi:predicted TIM-barrel fold metal-dependent hydrolase